MGGVATAVVVEDLDEEAAALYFSVGEGTGLVYACVLNSEVVLLLAPSGYANNL